MPDHSCLIFFACLVLFRDAHTVWGRRQHHHHHHQHHHQHHHHHHHHHPLDPTKLKLPARAPHFWCLNKFVGVHCRKCLMLVSEYGCRKSACDFATCGSQVFSSPAFSRLLNVLGKDPAGPGAPEGTGNLKKQYETVYNCSST